MIYVFSWIFGALFAFCWYLNSTRPFQLFKKIPGPRGIPVIGNFFMFFRRFEKLWDIQQFLFKEWSPTTAFHILNLWHVVVRHPDDLEIILSSQKCLSKGRAYKNLQPWLKLGLLTSTGEKWRRRRKVLTPAFHFNILKKYSEIFCEQSSKIVQELDAYDKETVHNLLTFSSKHTLDIVCESALGVKMDDFDQDTVMSYKKAIYNMGRVIIDRILRPMIIADWMMNWYLIPKAWKQKRALKVLHGFSGEVINNRKKFHENSGYQYLGDIQKIETDESWTDRLYLGQKNKLPLIDLLISAKRDKLIDDEGIQEEVDTFMFEGHDTSGTAMAFTLLLLANNQACQDRARAEIVQILHESNDEMTPKEIQKMEYLERCIKESLRLFPPVWMITRTVAEEFQLSKYTLPANTEIFVFIHDTHRNPDFWPDPETYDPDRFLPEKCATRHPFAYVPFSAGPRNCIGQKFAIMELKSIFARILQNYYIESITKPSDVRVWPDIIMRTEQPIFAKFVKIQKSNVTTAV